jgi:hypothetical protein
MGKSTTGAVVPPTTPVTVSLTLTLAEANNLLVALANAINNLGPKGKGKGGSASVTKGTPKGTAKGTPKGGSKPVKGPVGKPKS